MLLILVKLRERSKSVEGPSPDPSYRQFHYNVMFKFNVFSVSKVDGSTRSEAPASRVAVNSYLHAPSSWWRVFIFQEETSQENSIIGLNVLQHNALLEF